MQKMSFETKHIQTHHSRLQGDTLDHSMRARNVLHNSPSDCLGSDRHIFTTQQGVA